MSRQANPALIGAFVLGAILLVLAGLILLGGRSVFEDKTTCVTTFEEGIAGLDIGARVELGGVRVGTVTDIRIVFDDARKEVRRPVTFQLEHSRFSLKGGFERDKEAALLDAIREHGLRTQVALDNLLTGKLKVNMVFVTNSPPAGVRSDDHENAVEVPSTPSPFSSLVRTAVDLPLQDIILDVHQAVKAGQQTLATAAEVTHHLNDLVRNLNARMDPLAANLTRVAASTEQLITNLNRVAANAEQLTSADSELNGQTRATLEEVRAAARSLREFSDYASRHPESLLKGKP